MKNVLLRDKNNNPVCNNDTVFVPVRRVGSSFGNWYRETNKNHGLRYLKMKVVYKDFKYCLVPDRDNLSSLKDPIGKEIYKQEVAYPRELCEINCYAKKRNVPDFTVVNNEV